MTTQKSTVNAVAANGCAFSEGLTDLLVPLRALVAAFEAGDVQIKPEAQARLMPVVTHLEKLLGDAFKADAFVLFSWEYALALSDRIDAARHIVRLYWRSLEDYPDDAECLLGAMELLQQASYGVHGSVAMGLPMAPNVPSFTLTRLATKGGA